MGPCFVAWFLVSCLVAEEERAGGFTSLCCGCLCSLSRLLGGVDWSAVCDSSIFRSYSRFETVHQNKVTKWLGILLLYDQG